MSKELEKTGVFLHTVVVRVLADDPDISDVDLNGIAYEIIEGGWMGEVEVNNGEELRRFELEANAYEMGGEPGFFGEEFAGDEDE